MQNGEYIDKDGNLEITLEEYNKRTNDSMAKQFILWAVITFLMFGMFNLI